MPITLADLQNQDISAKLQVILMVGMGKPPLTPFKSLSAGGKRKFNEKLNIYIDILQDLEDNWGAQLQTDFNTACSEELFVDTFKAENQFVAILNTDIIRLRREGEENCD